MVVVGSWWSFGRVPITLNPSRVPYICAYAGDAGGRRLVAWSRGRVVAWSSGRRCPVVVGSPCRAGDISLHRVAGVPWSSGGRWVVGSVGRWVGGSSRGRVVAMRAGAKNRRPPPEKRTRGAHTHTHSYIHAVNATFSLTKANKPPKTLTFC